MTGAADPSAAAAAAKMVLAETEKYSCAPTMVNLTTIFHADDVDLSRSSVRMKIVGKNDEGQWIAIDDAADVKIEESEGFLVSASTIFAAAAADAAAAPVIAAAAVAATPLDLSPPSSYSDPATVQLVLAGMLLAVVARLTSRHSANVAVPPEPNRPIP